jgi:hypothetical protein
MRLTVNSMRVLLASVTGNDGAEQDRPVIWVPICLSVSSRQLNLPYAARSWTLGDLDMRCQPDNCMHLLLCSPGRCFGHVFHHAISGCLDTV